MYVRDVRTGITVSDREPEILKENAATAHVDGCNLLGPVVGNFCIDVAIQKAKTAGVGWVVAKGTFYFLLLNIIYVGRGEVVTRQQIKKKNKKKSLI